MIPVRIYNNENDNEIEPYLENYFESFINALNFDLNKLKMIYLSHNIVEDVLNFQFQNDLPQGITDFNGNKALAKNIYLPKEDKIVIFIEFKYGMFIMPEEIFHQFLNDLKREDLTRTRLMSLNLIAHELAHAEMNGKTINDNIVDYSTRGIYAQLCDRVFNEYYACRRASIIGFDCGIFSNDFKKEILKLENSIMEKRYEYAAINHDLNKFVEELYVSIRIALIYAVSHIANNNISDFNTYIDCKLNKILNQLINEFEGIYDKILLGETHYMFSDNTLKLISQYYNEFYVYLTDGENGIYYSIPSDIYYK